MPSLLGVVRACSVLFVGCVVSRVLCVVCWRSLPVIRTYVVVGVLLRGFFATTRKQYVVKTSVKKRHRIFCQKEVYRDSTRYIGIPLLVLLKPQ